MNVKGKTVCVTGVLAGMTRDEAEAGLTKLGAKVVGSISKNTNILFVGAQAGSKLTKAQSLGVEIADEAALQALLGAKISKAKISARVEEEEERRELEAEVMAEKAALPITLVGQVVVVTGTLSIERSEMEAMLTAAGAKVTGSVSKNTNLLVVGAGAGSKLLKAQSLGIRTISEEQARSAMKRPAPRGKAARPRG